jgi:hypothetical protein
MTTETTAPDAALLWAQKEWPYVPSNPAHLQVIAEAFRAGQAHDAGLLAALEGLVDALAANDEDGMTEFADVMVNARAAIAVAKGGRDAG